MVEFFQQYTREALKQDPHIDYIQGWQIQYLAFSKPQTAHLPPIVILGGAFQSFNSYKFWVEPMLEAGPVVLVDLPAMGSNPQLHNDELGRGCDSLSLVRIAELFALWLEKYQINKVSLMGMSLGSVVSAMYAAKNPERMHRIILMGVMQDTRDSWKMVIRESLHLLNAGNMDIFGQAVVLYLVNHAKLAVTKMNATARRMFYEQMATFNNNEVARYHINANRLLAVNFIPSPLCPVLVASGEFDSFTLPYENARYALNCNNMQFAVINDTDHLPQLQRRKETMGLFIAFFKAEPLEALPGVTLKTREQLLASERRRDERINPSNMVVPITTPAGNGNVQVLNYSYHGALLQVSDSAMLAALKAHDRACAITFDEGCSLELLAFEFDGPLVRVLFKHIAFAQSEALLAYIAANKPADAQAH